MNRMKPRFEPRSEQFTDLLNKANELADKVEKARSSQPEYSAKEGSEQGYEFFTQSAGKNNVRNQGYATNNHLIEVEDVKNKGAIMENSDVTTRESPYYPTAFSTTGALENFTGGEGPVLKSAGGNIQKYQDQQIKKSIETLSRRIN